MMKTLINKPALNESPSNSLKRLQKRNPYIDINSPEEEKGISLSFFIENTTFMKGILPEVSKIIITALGLDADSQTTTISWENYVVLY